jgi:hypothetical protein
MSDSSDYLEEYNSDSEVILQAEVLNTAISVSDYDRSPVIISERSNNVSNLGTRNPSYLESNDNISVASTATRHSNNNFRSNQNYEAQNCRENYSTNETLLNSHRPTPIDTTDIEPIYTLESLELLNDNFIFNILKKSPMIIFIRNNKLKRFCFPIKNNSLGCTLLPFEFSFKLKKIVKNININIQNTEDNFGESEGVDIQSKIYFTDDSIVKNIMYKCLEIREKIIFVPYDKYYLKLTEYKLRSFCQLVEELGALKIKIKFKNNNNSSEEKNTTVKASDDLNNIAGELGFEKNKTKDEKEEYDYELNYPPNNNVILNEKNILKKIKKKKLLISQQELNSNIELQTVLSSRCRHFIQHYCVVFKIESLSKTEEKIISSLKGYGVKFNFLNSLKRSKSNNMSIITNVEFGIPLIKEEMTKEYNYNISGANVSFDYIGFNLILSSFSPDLFEKIGIYKIMEFLNGYIKKVLKYEDLRRANKVRKILVKINKHFTLQEYADILVKYFNYNSQWVHFENFIKILESKALIFDKLGYLILVYNDMCYNQKMETLLNFIEHLTQEEPQKFQLMLKPYNRDYVNLLSYKIEEINILNKYNWYNFEKLINNIKKYNDKINYSNLNSFEDIYNNMKIGYEYPEFYYHIHNLVMNILNLNDNYNDNKFKLIFYKMFHIEEIFTNNINTNQKFKNYFDNKLQLLKEANEIYNKIKDNSNFTSYFNNDECHNNYKYFYKMRKYVNLSGETKNDLKKLLESMLIYDLNFNKHKIPSNQLGYELTLNQIHSGILEEEITKNINFFKYYTNRYNKIIVNFDDELKNFLKNNNNNNNYRKFLEFISDNCRVEV